MLTMKIAAMVLAAGGAGAVGAGAWQAHAAHGRSGHPMMEKFVDFVVDQKLDAIAATDVQRQRVADVKARLVSEGRALHEGRDSLHQELFEQLSSASPDAARMKALVRQRTDAIGRFGDDVVDAVVELHAVFTPEQRQQLLAEAREHARRRHGH